MDALGDAPVHARRLLFGTLVDSLGDDSLAILSALLLRRAVTVEEKAGRGGKKKRASEEEDPSSTLVEVAHQTVHGSGGQAQVKTDLIEMCVYYRMMLHFANREADNSIPRCCVCVCVFLVVKS